MAEKMLIVRRWLVILLAALAWTAAAASSAPAQTAPTTTAEDYILGPADVIEVDLLGQTDFTTKQRITEEGRIRLPLIGVVQAADLTVAQLGDRIADMLKKGGFYTNPIVKIDVTSYGSRYVTALGDFTTPGLIPIDHPYRVSEIVARAGGVKDLGADYVVFRPLHGAERRLKLSELATGDLKDDPYVSPGDKLYSPPAELVYVSGQVKSPGAFPITPGMTIRMALSRGGGVTDLGTDHRVTLTRDGKKQTRVDLDQPVAPGDVLVVGTRLF